MRVPSVSAPSDPPTSRLAPDGFTEALHLAGATVEARGAPLAHEDHAQRACYAALQGSFEIRASKKVAVYA